jgi:hypothetical protein
VSCDCSSHCTRPDAAAAAQACLLGGSMRFVNASYILFGLPLVSEYGSVVGLHVTV